MPTITHNYNAALFCMSAAIGFSSFHHSGITVNVQDIAPRFTGSVFGLYLLSSVLLYLHFLSKLGNIRHVRGNDNTISYTNSIHCEYFLHCSLLFFICYLFNIFHVAFLSGIIIQAIKTSLIIFAVYVCFFFTADIILALLVTKVSPSTYYRLL